MPFGPFISQEEKDAINRSLHINYGYQPRNPKQYGKPPVQVQMAPGQHRGGTRAAINKDPKAPFSLQPGTSLTASERRAARKGQLRRALPATAAATGMPDIRGTSGNDYKADELALATAARPAAPATQPPQTPATPPADPPMRPDESTKITGGVAGSGRQLGGMMSLEDATKLSGGYLADLANYFPQAAPSPQTAANIRGVVINGTEYSDLSPEDLSEAQEAWLTSNPNERAGNFLYDTNDQARTVAMPGAPTNWMQAQPGSLARNASRAFLDAPRDRGAMGALRARDAQLGIVEGAGGKKYAQINGQMVQLGDDQYGSIIGRDVEQIRGIIGAYPADTVMPGGNVAPENVAISPAQTQQPAFGIDPAVAAAISPLGTNSENFLSSGVLQANLYAMTPEGAPNTAYSQEIFERSMQMPIENLPKYDMLTDIDLQDLY